MSQNDSKPIDFVVSTDKFVAAQQLQTATTIIDYQSAGHCIVVARAGDNCEQAIDDCLALCEQLQPLSCNVAVIDATVATLDKRLTESGRAVFVVPSLRVSGHLGAFTVTTDDESPVNLAVSLYLEQAVFDLVLDTADQSVLPVALPPLGYFRANTPGRRADSIRDMPGLVGEFEKPKYFDYNASICAHSRSELSGCNACMQACATGAIQSDGEGITVDPYLCQGCGSCATVCPTGAMVYAYPKPASAISRTQELLKEGGQKILLLHAEEHEELVAPFESSQSVLPLLVEEVSAFGIDYWASMLCAGAHHILLLTNDDSLEQSLQALDSQMALLGDVLSGLGIEKPVVSRINSEALETLDSGALYQQELSGLDPAAFATHNDKRQTFRMAIDTLAEQLTPKSEHITLDASAPFGLINVDTDKCTLCMACVSVCPAKALLDGQDTPALRMIEANCVQCGMCEAACPETAIERTPRYSYNSIEARKIQTLNEEAPFNCIRCQKPFATARIIQSMFEKLDGHWMFKDDVAKRRLKMCEDCRVKDIFETDASGIEVHRSEKA